MESYFGRSRNNILNRRSWATRQQLRIAIVPWIEPDLPPPKTPAVTVPVDPVEFETIMHPPASQAALLHLSPAGAADPFNDHWV